MSETRCLCCGKALTENDENENQWHKQCCYKFFGTKIFPEINISKDIFEEIAYASVSKGFTIAGVQKKLSLHLSSKKGTRLTLVGYPQGYILKPQTDEFAHLPEMENLVMRLASCCGIQTVPNALVKMQDGFAYITKRIDRIITKTKVQMLAMEDFCQLSERQTDEKYKSSYEQCAKVIKKYSSKSGLDTTELFYRLVFCFITGNSDMHLKNFSLIEESPRSRVFSLSPAYDLLPVNLAVPDDNEEFALTMNGKKSKLKLEDFYTFAKWIELSEKVAQNLVKKIISYKNIFIKFTENSFLPSVHKQRMVELIESRVSRLE